MCITAFPAAAPAETTDHVEPVHLCPDCGAAEIEPGRSVCWDCLGKRLGGCCYWSRFAAAEDLCWKRSQIRDGGDIED